MNSSTETTRIQGALKELLKKRGLSYALLALELGVSLPTMKRMLNAPDLSIARLVRICEALGVDLHDLLELTRKPESDLHFFTPEQERFFARQPHFLYYLLALHSEGKSPEQIEKEAGISRTSTQRYLATLFEMDLVHFTAGRQVRSRVKGLIGWDEKGPLGKAVSARWIRRMAERITEDAGLDPYVEFSGRMLTAKEYQQMKADFAAVVAKYRRISKINSASKEMSRFKRYEVVLMADRVPSWTTADIPELPRAGAGGARPHIRPVMEVAR